MEIHMAKHYEEAELELVRFNAADVIACSACTEYSCTGDCPDDCPSDGLPGSGNEDQGNGFTPPRL